MSILNTLIKCLQENQKVSNWLINEINNESYESFYVLQKLETTRIAKTTEYIVTVYYNFEENKYTGSSSFVVSHDLKKSEINKLIEEALYSSSFVKNKAYDIVLGTGKKSYKEKPLSDSPFELSDKIANIFFEDTKSNIKFNALEIFVRRTTTHVVNSKGVNLQKTLNSIFVESIPSYDGNKALGEQKVELYKSFIYNDVDFIKIKEDAKLALADVEKRFFAEKIKDITKMDIILKESEVKEFMFELIENYSYADIYKGTTDKKIGDMIQKDIKGDALTISLQAPSKCNVFDNEGSMAVTTKVIENGKIVNNYGSNRFAYYLGQKSTGNAVSLKLEKGKTSIQKMTNTPHIEIIALSGIQIEMYSNYIGGEVRLANYFDGKENHPISGFSFSGNIDECLSDIVLSKETTKINKYNGPKYIKIKNLEIL